MSDEVLRDGIDFASDVTIPPSSVLGVVHLPQYDR
jgi:hypothetical protein